MGIEVWLYGIGKLGEDNGEIKWGHFSIRVDKSNNKKKRRVKKGSDNYEINYFTTLDFGIWYRLYHLYKSEIHLITTLIRLIRDKPVENLR